MFVRTKDKILDMENTNKCIYVIRDTSKETENCYVSYLWDNWKEYYLIDYQNCMLFSYNSAQSFISDLIKENLNYQNLVIELSLYYKDCNQSENLEELCDEFVIVLENADGQKIYSINYALCEAIKDKDLMIKVVSNKDLKYEFNIYGAVWSEFGLKYVAKMDNEGKLMLI